MDQKDHNIMKDIDDTHTAMNDKIGMIENRVHETIEGTQSTIDNVMDNVKRVQGTVEQTKSTLDNILATIKDSVDETIERVKYTADLIEQVNQNPWIMFGGAILAGYVLSSINRGGSLGGRRAPEWKV
jgi:methyl-accepting chemotaxis protein